MNDNNKKYRYFINKSPNFLWLKNLKKNKIFKKKILKNINKRSNILL